MMKGGKLILGFLALTLIGMGSCTNESVNPMDPIDEAPYKPVTFEIVIPDGFPKMVIPDDNPTTLEGVTLGRMLYYDQILDKDSARACASCHIQNQAFQVDNGPHQVLPHVNFAWSNRYMWNGGFEMTLEEVMLFEVEEFFETDLQRLNESEKYREMFRLAFNVDVITSKEVAYALAQFQRTMISGNSKFDQFYRGKAILTSEEERGFNLFFSEEGDCFHCHGTALLTDNMPRNNGLDEYPDLGLMEATNNPDDRGKFKVPTLRNIAVTAPYMHDGRYETLEEVVEFYSTGLKYSPTIDTQMKFVGNGGNQLSEEDKAALVAFLKTLTDQEFLTTGELANPL